MKKEELKKILKPLIKECIKEVMFEQGVLSRVVTEVAQGMSSSAPVQQISAASVEQQSRDMQLEQKRRALEEDRQRRKELLDKVGSVNGVNVFEGTEPIPTAGQAGKPNPQSPLSGIDPNDSGVDISSIIGASNGAWSVLKGR